MWHSQFAVALLHFAKIKCRSSSTGVVLVVFV